MRRNFLEAENVYPQFSDLLGERLSAERKNIFELTFEKIPELAWRQISEANRQTITHGDAHFWNFLFPNKQDASQCILYDWSEWEITLPVRDLTHMITLFCFRDYRQRMEQTLLRFYLYELSEQEINYNIEDLLLDYRVYVIINLLRPITQFSQGVPASFWWDMLDKAFSAFDDLECMELLQ